MTYRFAARMTDFAICPHPLGIGVATQFQVLVNSRPALRLGDWVPCQAGMSVVFQGASTVLVQGLPASGLGHTTAEGGAFILGSPDVYLGGPTFSLPANLSIKGDADFKNKVIRDYFLLSTTPTGQRQLDAIAESGQQVNVYPTSGDPITYPNPRTEDAGTGGNKAGSDIYYNPNQNLTATDGNGNQVPLPPQVALAHEDAHAIANGAGAMPPSGSTVTTSVGDQQQQLDAREAQAIGTGDPYSSSTVSENGVRNNLTQQTGTNYGQRANHAGSDASSGPGLRPGGY